MASLTKNPGAGAKSRAVSPQGTSFISEQLERKVSSVQRHGKLPEGGLPGVSHELRNLLTALNLYSELLAEPGVLTLPHRHMAEEIKLIAKAGKRLLDALNRIPFISAVQESTVADAVETPISGGEDGAGQVNGMVSERHLAPILDSCLPLLAHLAGPQVHVHLKCTRNHGSFPLSSEDLTMILVNLVRNSAEAMPGGGGVWIAIQPVAKNCNGTAKYARIVVEDDGPGIPVKVRAHLFESGFTTKQSAFCTDRAVAPEHHGLGLAIVRRQVESAGGVIQARQPSAKGGARFEIRIPFVPIKVQRKLQKSGATICKEQITGAKEPE